MAKCEPGCGGQSLLCCALMRTWIVAAFVPLSSANQLGLSITDEELLKRMNESGNPRRAIQPEEVAEYVLEGIQNDSFWILRPLSRDGYFSRLRYLEPSADWVESLR